MSRIKGRDTKPEMVLRKELWKRGLRYRVHYKIKGKPDIVFVRKRVAVFVDGCFWHGCPEHGKLPKANADFWESKLKGNIERDVRVSEELEGRGWLVLRFWEHEVVSDLPSVMESVILTLSSRKPIKV